MPKLLPGVTVYTGRKKYSREIPEGLNVPASLIEWNVPAEDDFQELDGVDEVQEVFCEEPTIIHNPPPKKSKRRVKNNDKHQKIS